MFLKSLFLAGATLSLTTASAILTPLHDTAAPRSLSTRQSCTNGPNSRNCWDGTHDIKTDSEVAWPVTGRVVPVSYERVQIWPWLTRDVVHTWDFWAATISESIARWNTSHYAINQWHISWANFDCQYVSNPLLVESTLIPERLGRWVRNHCHKQHGW